MMPLALRAAIAAGIAGAALRAWLALAHVATMPHPDAVFQSMDVAHRWVYGTGYVAPEYQMPGEGWLMGVDGQVVGPIESIRSCRSPLHPLFFAAVQALAGRWAGAPYHAVVLPLQRALAAVIAGLLPVAVWYLTLCVGAAVRPEGRRGADGGVSRLAVVAAWWAALDPYGLDVGSITYVQPFVAPALLWSLGGVLQAQTCGAATVPVVAAGFDDDRAAAPPAGRVHSARALSAGLVLAVCCYMRPDAALTAAAVLASVAAVRRWVSTASARCSRQAAMVAAGAIAGVVLMGALDAAYYGVWFVSAANWVRFNLLEQLSRLSGSQPAGYYWTAMLQATPATLAAFLLAPVAALWPHVRGGATGASDDAVDTARSADTDCGRWTALAMWLAAALQLAAFSSQPHKEARFIYHAAAVSVIPAAFAGIRTVRALANGAVALLVWLTGATALDTGVDATGALGAGDSPDASSGSSGADGDESSNASDGDADTRARGRGSTPGRLRSHSTPMRSRSRSRSRNRGRSRSRSRSRAQPRFAHVDAVKTLRASALDRVPVYLLCVLALSSWHVVRRIPVGGDEALNAALVRVGSLADQGEGGGLACAETGVRGVVVGTEWSHFAAASFLHANVSVACVVAGSGGRTADARSQGLDPEQPCTDAAPTLDALFRAAVPDVTRYDTVVVPTANVNAALSAFLADRGFQLSPSDASWTAGRVGHRSRSGVGSDEADVVRVYRRCATADAAGSGGGSRGGGGGGRGGSDGGSGAEVRLAAVRDAALVAHGACQAFALTDISIGASPLDGSTGSTLPAVVQRTCVVGGPFVPAAAAAVPSLARALVCLDSSDFGCAAREATTVLASLATERSPRENGGGIAVRRGVRALAHYALGYASLLQGQGAEALSQLARGRDLDGGRGADAVEAADARARHVASGQLCECHHSYHTGHMPLALFQCTIAAMFARASPRLHAWELLGLVLWQVGGSHDLPRKWARSVVDAMAVEEDRRGVSDLHTHLVPPLASLLAVMAQTQGFLDESARLRVAAADADNAARGDGAGTGATSTADGVDVAWLLSAAEAVARLSDVDAVAVMLASPEVERLTRRADNIVESGLVRGRSGHVAALWRAEAETLHLAFDALRLRATVELQIGNVGAARLHLEAAERLRCRGGPAVGARLATTQEVKAATGARVCLVPDTDTGAAAGSSLAPLWRFVDAAERPGVADSTADRAAPIAIASMHDAGMGGMGEMWERQALNYAGVHGYTVVVQRSVVDASRPAAWSKIRLLQHLLERRRPASDDSAALKAGAREFQWVVWMDADSLVANTSLPLEWFTSDLHTRPPALTGGGCAAGQGADAGSCTDSGNAAGGGAHGCESDDEDTAGRGGSDDGPDLVVMADMHMVMNTGIIAVRNTAWARRYLQRVWDAHSDPRHVNSPFWENAAMVSLHFNDADVRAHTAVLPYGTLHVYPPQHRVGAFIVQLPGTDEKENKMRMWDAVLSRAHERHMRALGATEASGPAKGAGGASVPHPGAQLEVLRLTPAHFGDPASSAHAPQQEATVDTDKSATRAMPATMATARPPSRVDMLSAVVPTHASDVATPEATAASRAGLASVIASLAAAQAAFPWLAAELIVVVDGTAGGTLQSVRELLAAACSRPHCVMANDHRAAPAAGTQRRAGPVQCRVRAGDSSAHGAGWARNTGARASAGDVLLFNDADDTWMLDHATTVMRAFEATPALAYVKTPVQVSTPVHPHWAPIIDHDLVINLAVRRAAFDFIGGFLELPGAGGEDSELNAALALVFRGARQPSVEEPRRVRATSAREDDQTDGTPLTHGAPGATVVYHRRAGGTLDRQLPKFQRGPEHEARYVAESGDAYDPAYHAQVRERQVRHRRRLESYAPPDEDLYLFAPAYRHYGLHAASQDHGPRAA